MRYAQRQAQRRPRFAADGSSTRRFRFTTSGTSHTGTDRNGNISSGNKQLKQLRTDLSNQQKQLKATPEALGRTRSNLEASLSATRDDLNGSIARTHEEVVALARRGERSYFEFHLMKNAGFERSGPFSCPCARRTPNISALT
jgi:hypothetical protein